MEIINDLLLSHLEAIVKAAGVGCVEWLEKLLSRNTYEATTTAAVAAASNGRVEVLKFLYGNWGLALRRDSTTQKSLAVAAENGYIEVVEFLVTQVDRTMWSGAALSKARAKGDISMVKLLLDPKKFTWDFREAVNQAIAANQSAVVEVIHQSFPYQAYDPNPRKDTMIAHMARRGHSDIVKYLYERGLWAWEDIPGAFVAAADSGYLEPLQFLYDTELISVETLNEAFEKTLSTEVATYLYDTNLILADTLKTVFLAQQHRWSVHGGARAKIVRVLLEERAVPAEIISEAASYAATWGAFDLFKVFYEAGCYSTDEIIAAFKRAATHNLTNRLELLNSEKCISNAVRGEALVESAKRGCYFVVKWLFEPHRFRNEVITEAFVEASKHWHNMVMKLLYKDQQASAAVIGDLLQHAVSTGHFPVARPNLTEAMKNEALLTVARRERRQDGAQKFIMKAHCWSQEILRQGLEVATDDKIKSILNGMIA